jgi:hypothetical protein
MAKKLTIRSPRRLQKLDTFSAQRDELFHQSLSKAGHERSSSKILSNKKCIALTSSAEVIGRGVSREVLIVDAFFRRLEARELAFLAAAFGDLGTTTASYEGGALITGASTMGAVATYFFGSSLSLKKKQKSKTLCASQHKEKYIKTHESKASKSSSSSSRAEASPATFLWAEVLKERSSLTHFLFLSRPRSSESAGGGDVVELVLSSESSVSSPSWLSSASGASDTAETGTF